MARHISIADYAYPLPDERIARNPLAERDRSKLLVYRNGNISETVFGNLSAQLPEQALLVFNNTKVIYARLLFQTEANAQIEIFLLEPAGSITVEEAMHQNGKGEWICLVGNYKKFNQLFLEKQITFQDYTGFIRVHKPQRQGDAFIVRLEWDSDKSFAELLLAAGNIPLPPYLKREPEENDRHRYQTVYAEHEGSVAAPTAGLHFTKSLIDKLKSDGHATAELILHVGAGTFRPVKAEKMEMHEMHAEEIHVTRKTLEQLRQHAGNIIAVGTTSLRTLESIFWFGLQLKLFPAVGLHEIHIKQWEGFDQKVPADFTFAEALALIINRLDREGKEYISGKTQIMIAPGYVIRSARGLITNFHQPGSTLLLLVAAFAGDDWRRIYEYALLHDFRFLSYGDGSLLLR